MGSNNPKVLLSAFADEGANKRTVREQLSTIAAVGLRYYSARFIDFGRGESIEHIMSVTPTKLGELNDYNGEYGLQIAELGTAIGKSKLIDQEDGTNNKFLPDSAVMDQLNHAIELCTLFKTKMIRGFSFYHPKWTSAGAFTGHAVERLGPIAERCREAGVVFGMEIEANLVGEDGETLAEIHRQLANDNVVTVWDGANVACRNIDAAGCLAQYRLLESSLGWSHVKDYRIQSGLPWTGHVDETRLKHFVPAGQGDAGYPEFLADLRTNFDSHAARATQLGLPGVFLTLEPHLKGGGQFGGFSGPDGVGVALRALCKLLDQAQIDYDLCDMPDIIERRGF